MFVKSFVLGLIVVGGSSWAQSPASARFDVASFKPVQGNGSLKALNGGPGTPDPGRISYASATLRQILAKAFGVESDQIAGPAWMDSEKYEVRATMPTSTSPEGFKIMLQGLLTERLGLAVHHEMRNLPVYVIARGKGSLKLVPSAALRTGDTAAPPDNLPQDPDGCPVLPAGIHGYDGRRNAQGIECDSYGGYTMPELAHTVAGLLKLGQGLRQPAHVVERTGLQGAFDFRLKFHLELVGPAMAAALPLDGTAGDPLGDNMSSLVRALDQVGLSLRKTTESLDTIVIDRVERVPVEN